MDFSTILEDLNQPQKSAVSSNVDYLLVLAGAGSGKTRVLVHRIAWLILNQSLSPNNILAVTFTNKAAAEMRTRIESLLNQNLYRMWVGTFHSLAHRMLRTHWQSARLTQNFQILDSEDQLRMIKRVHKELNLDEQLFPPKQSQWTINHYKDEGKKPKDIKPSPDKKEQTLLSVYHAYEQACERASVVDFSELLLRSVELLKSDPHLLNHYQSRFKHILVDEFQDTNKIQYEWIKLLTGPEAQITVVGDDDQSIYGWRGARIENIQRFEQEFKHCETIRLEQNYRSAAPILKAANAVISHNMDRLGKELWTNTADGQPIQLYAAFNEVEEARFIAERCEYWQKQGVALKDMSVLYRSNAQSRVIEEAFIRNQIEYRIHGGMRFFDRAEIKNALAYLRLAASEADDAAFERVVNFPTRGIGEKTLEQIRTVARQNNRSLWDTAEQLLAENSLPGRAHHALSLFTQLIKEIQEQFSSLSLTECVQFILDRSSLKAYYRKEKGDKAQARLDNLNELLTATKEFEADDSVPKAETLSLFLDHVALESGDNQADAHTDAVQLMTLHASKGLEFPIVFLVGMEEGLFPSRRSLNEAGRLEEERRLCYVGITRAMKQLYITYAELRRLYGEEHYSSVSRFVKEIPADTIQEVRLNATVRRPLSFSHSPRQAPTEHEQGFSVGERVLHGKFGEGTVLDYEGSGNKSRIQINFDSYGSKWLITSMAKLKSLEIG